jgi:hypothetical protein
MPSPTYRKRRAAKIAAARAVVRDSSPLPGQEPLIEEPKLVGGEESKEFWQGVEEAREQAIRKNTEAAERAIMSPRPHGPCRGYAGETTGADQPAA